MTVYVCFRHFRAHSIEIQPVSRAQTWHFGQIVHIGVGTKQIRHFRRPVTDYDNFVNVFQPPR